MKRRTFINGTLATGLLGVAAGTGLLTSRSAYAAWPESAFRAENANAALNSLHGVTETIETDKIKVEAPDIAENGAVVPVTVTSSLPMDSVTILVPKNPSSLVGHFRLSGNAAGEISTRIKMGETSDVVAVVKSGDKLYSARKLVKVTIGGCGG